MQSDKKQEVLDTLKGQHHKLSLVLIQGRLMDLVESIADFSQASNIKPAEVYRACNAYCAERRVNESYAEMKERIMNKFPIDDLLADNFILIFEFNNICTEIMEKMVDQKNTIGNAFTNRSELRDLEKILMSFMEDVAGVGHIQSQTFIRTFENNINSAIEEQLGAPEKLSMTR